MSFEPGQLIECVDVRIESAPYPGIGELDGLQVNRIYTVRRFEPAYTDPGVRFAIPVVWLEEIIRPWPNWPGETEEPPFFALRFRPLQNSRIAVFRQILAQTPRELEQV